MLIRGNGFVCLAFAHLSIRAVHQHTHLVQLLALHFVPALEPIQRGLRHLAAHAQSARRGVSSHYSMFYARLKRRLNQPKSSEILLSPPAAKSSRRCPHLPTI
eukprot:1195582-Prorocentrum_minimum.AAC.3